MTNRITPVGVIERALEAATTPEELVDLEHKIAMVESYLKLAGLTSKVRPYNEAKMLARWKLGRLLKKMARAKVPGPGRGKVGQKALAKPPNAFMAYLKSISLEWKRAQEAQRIAAMPESELRKALAENADSGDLTSVDELVKRARPYWYQESRKARHQSIRRKATERAVEEVIGPFPLLYADPPWRFKIYSEKGLERTPDQHYETLSYEEICDFEVQGKRIRDLATPDAALFLWCTSSNVHLALGVMEAWDFEFKASAVWVKDKTGLGLVFRNKHELLLYGTRGAMPGPQYQPPSVFEYPRGLHSAKPPEIRAEIEKMYPDFAKENRIELFARGAIPGWTTDGFEAEDSVAA